MEKYRNLSPGFVTWRKYLKITSTPGKKFGILPKLRQPCINYLQFLNQEYDLIQNWFEGSMGEVDDYKRALYMSLS